MVPKVSPLVPNPPSSDYHPGFAVFKRPWDLPAIYSSLKQSLWSLSSTRSS